MLADTKLMYKQTMSWKVRVQAPKTLILERNIELFCRENEYPKQAVKLNNINVAKKKKRVV